LRRFVQQRLTLVSGRWITPAAMSDHGHAAHAEPAGGHDHHYEGVPADRPGPDEPTTPGWMPLLGIGIVLAGILSFVLIQPDGKTRDQLTAEAPKPAEPAAAAAPSPEEPTAERRPARPVPSGMRALPMPSGFPRGAGSAMPRRPGPFALPGGSAAPRRRPPADDHAGHNHP
jgi:hypothetical protein